MEAFESRKEKAKFVLEICLNLPKEDEETVITLLSEIIDSSEKVPEGAELGK